jgi:catechol 2,3-dioxygenase-like lactoylglutathione lyase family enzyme
MIDHVTVPVSDYERSKAFYVRALEPLGYVVLLDWHEARRVYLGLPGRPSSLWLVETEAAGRVELCLVAASADVAQTVGPRLVDPDGNVVEVVYRDELGLRAA